MTGCIEKRYLAAIGEGYLVGANVLGNAIATAVVAKWEGDEEQESCADLAVEPQLMPEPIRARA